MIFSPARTPRILDHRHKFSDSPDDENGRIFPGNLVRTGSPRGRRHPKSDCLSSRSICRFSIPRQTIGRDQSLANINYEHCQLCLEHHAFFRRRIRTRTYLCRTCTYLLSPISTKRIDSLRNNYDIVYSQKRYNDVILYDNYAQPGFTAFVQWGITAIPHVDGTRRIRSTGKTRLMVCRNCGYLHCRFAHAQ